MSNNKDGLPKIIKNSGSIKGAIVEQTQVENDQTLFQSNNLIYVSKKYAGFYAKKVGSLVKRSGDQKTRRLDLA
ncbi:hypothetical protein GCM10020331_001070 [Ectobacillus funiculus]